MHKPQPSEYPDYYQYYIDLVKEPNGIKAMEEQILEMQLLLANIPAEMEEYAYDKGKWTIKELVGHINDTERIMAFRALCFARNEKTGLPGFDENAYVKSAGFNARSLYDLVHEFCLIRESNIALFKTFPEEIFDRRGMANNYLASVRAIVYMMIGHVTHHQEIVRKKYIKTFELLTT